MLAVMHPVEDAVGDTQPELELEPVSDTNPVEDADGNPDTNPDGDAFSNTVEDPTGDPAREPAGQQPPAGGVPPAGQHRSSHHRPAGVRVPGRGCAADFRWCGCVGVRQPFPVGPPPPPGLTPT
jgi:hypothetical protein